MFSEPPASRLDLRFGFSGIRVRVHPMFWIIVFALGWNLPLVEQLVWVGVVFVSILVHELGHVSSALFFGRRSHVVLYSMGGLTIPEAHASPLTGWRYGVVAFSGPMAGLLLALLAYLTIPLLGSTSSGLAGALYFHLVGINVVWSLVNLLPIWPLDGGQVMRSLLSDFGSDFGYSLASGLSLVTAGIVAVAAWQMSRPIIGLFAVYFALKEWQQSV
jgi:stage IV sporulation protein FB